MSRATSHLSRDTRALFAAGTVTGLTDSELLWRFVNQPGDVAEASFAALVARHGPMILGTCSRRLADPHDAEDAFQTTFLVLVRKAKTVKVEGSLAPWLYGVCHRVVLRVRAETTRRRAKESSEALAQLPAPEEAPTGWDLRLVIDEELAQLPEPYQAPVLLCDLEGISLEEAARQLHCPVGTVKSRLFRARARLGRRLARRGLGLPAVTPSRLLSAELATARVMPRLAEATVQGATKLVGGDGTMAGTFSAPVIALTQGVLKTMLLTHLKKVAVCLLVLGSAGGFVLGQQSPQADPRPGSEQDQTGSPLFSRAVLEAADQRIRSRALQLALAPLEQEKQETGENVLVKWLEESITLDGTTRSFGEMLDLIRGGSGIPLVVDPKSLADGGAQMGTSVFLPACTLPRKTALQVLLKPLGMGYRIVREVIMLDSLPGAPMVLAAYPVSDLVREAPKNSEIRVDLSSLAKLFTTSVAPGTWRICDDSGKILNADDLKRTRYESYGKITLDGKSGTLIVFHSREVQEEARLWFEQFRTPNPQVKRTGP